MTTKAAQQHKCRTCFALVENGVHRCPLCNAYQDRRRHLTVPNLLVAALLLLFGYGLYVCVPLLRAMTIHTSNVRAEGYIYSMNEKVVQEIQLMNDGDRPAMVLMIKTEFKDASGKTSTIMENAEMWEEPLTVKAGNILQRKIILQRCPATVSDVNTNVRIRNFDGTTEAIKLPMDARITCTNVNAPSTH